MDKYNELSKKYDVFIYDSYSLLHEDGKMKITFHFKIPNLTEFNPTLVVDDFEINDFTKYLVFHIGMVELISYWKCCCSKNVVIKAGYLNDDQIKFFKKLYFNGLSELFYRNNIDVSIDDFMNISILCPESKISFPSYNGIGNLIPIGGGKDSNVTLEVLKSEFDINTCIVMNPKEVHFDCCKVASYNEDKIVVMKRTIDKNLLDLNSQGFINGHTPFSSLVAFTCFLEAYINNKKYIVLSNESSANESNIEGTNINHQYSKTYEFENDFNNYINKYFKINIKYFSILRPLTEYQIGMMFSNYKKYHKVFKSCNLGSKKNPWEWCNNCPKCLFVFTILSPFLYKDELVDIFGEDLFLREDLLNTFLELAGKSDQKPFECVGTYSEVRYAISKTIRKSNKLPYLLQYYKDHYDLEDEGLDLENKFNNEHNLDEHFLNLLKEELSKCINK